VNVLHERPVFPYLWVSEDDTDKMRFYYNYRNIQDGWGWVKWGMTP